MVAGYRIHPARRRDLVGLPDIERAAARLLVGHVPASVLAETHSPDEFDAARRAGHLWVARTDQQPVGFALAEMLGGRHPHLAELDVHPAHGRRGIGAALVRAVCRWAEPRGALTLTTFRDLAWNMPFYARLGFEVVPSDSLSARLAAVVRDEAVRGLDPARRVVMRWPGRRAR